MSFLENHYEKKKISKYFQKPTPRPKIDLGNESKKKWVKNSELKCFVSYTCLRTCFTNAWYFDSDCSRHMMGNKDILVNDAHCVEYNFYFASIRVAQVIQ